MRQSQPTTSTLFRTSLRDWKERWKARQLSETTDGLATTREKKLIARKRRKRSNQSVQQS